MTKDGTIYPVTLHITKAKDGRIILYDVNVRIKEGVATDKNATSQLAKQLNGQAVRTTTPSISDNVAQNGEDVKYSLSDDSDGASWTPMAVRIFTRTFSVRLLPPKSLVNAINTKTDIHGCRFFAF